VLASGPALPRAGAVHFDARVFAFTFLLCLGSGLLLALPAALLTTRFELVKALKEQSGSVAGAPALRARMLFVGAQVALALVLLTGAVTAGQTLVRQLTLNPGFDPSGIATTQLFPPVPRYPTREAIAALYARILDEVRAVPGVRAASAVSAAPLSGEGREPEEFTIEGRPAAGRARPEADAYNVAPGYFQTLDAPLHRGRDFTGEDTAAAPHVAIVNDTFVRRYLPDGDPLHAVLRFEDGDVVRIVGVCRDFLHSIGPRAAPEAEMYFPYSQRPRWATMIVVRSSTAGAASVMALVRDRIRGIDPQIRSGTPVLMADRLTRSARSPRFVVLLFGVFAAVALLLSVVGVAGLVFYTLTQRTREIAIRVSLGATARDLRRLVGGGAFLAVLAGSVVGLSGTVLLSRALESTLRQLDPLRASGLAAAWALLVALGWLACYVPARRALTIDPSDALRLE
jgi:putative ABC transport system permease protein